MIDHFREAERALEIADSDLRNNDAEGSRNYIARAQVHATLAQTAVAREYAAALNAFMASMTPAPEAASAPEAGDVK